MALKGAGAITRMFSDPVRRNVLVLAVCQAMGSTGTSMLAAVASLVGYALVEDKSIATLPVAVQWTATMFSTIPASHLMRWIGRRAGLSVGVIIQMTDRGEPFRSVSPRQRVHRYRCVLHAVLPFRCSGHGAGKLSQ
jgi:MFS family permease